MKIVINALQYRPDASGIAICMRELFGPFTKITHQQTQIVLPRNSPSFPCAKTTNLTEAPCTYNEGARRILFQSFILGIKYCKDAVLLTIDSKIPLILPRSSKLIPLVTDLAVFRLPAAYQRSRELLWKLQYRYLCRRGDHFLAISEFTKREMTTILGIAPERIDVIPCAGPNSIQRVNEEAILQSMRGKYHLNAPYVLFVGNYNPRKNLERLICAFDKMKRETELPHELVIAGGQGWKFDADKALKDITAKDAIRFIGYVPDEDMSAMYSGASLFVFPTLYEGFGIPLIEAQTCGVPVLASNGSALPETGGDGAFYVDPYDEGAIARGMTELLNDPARREELVQKGFQNVKRFSWEASAHKLNEIIEKL